MSWPGTLARRLLIIGVAQLILLAAVFMGVGWIVNGAPPEVAGHPPSHGPPHDGPPPDGRPRNSPPGRPHSRVTPLDTLFVAGLVIVGVGSLLTARGIVQPLRQLSRAANAIGAGDLRARSGIDRADELGDLARSLDNMAARIEQLVLAQKELLANVSHELRTPLARIRVAMDIADESEGETQRLSISEIGVDLAELETLIDDILTTTRLELASGASTKAKLDLHEQELTVESICQSSAARFRARHPVRPLDVVGVDPSAVVRADPVLFRRALDNLLENAHKYSPDASRAIVLRVSAEASRVTFVVEDHGIGIAADDLPHVFTPFFRGERSRARGAGGVGLGLTLTQRIVEAHGGTIRIESELDRGTTARIELARVI
jgi:signal transduction histidine kinase